MTAAVLFSALGGLQGHKFDGADYLSMSASDFGSITRSKWAIALEFKLKDDTGIDQGIYSLDDQVTVAAKRISAASFRIEVSGFQEGSPSTFSYVSGITFSPADIKSILFHYDSADTGMTLWVNGTLDTANSESGGNGALEDRSGSNAAVGAKLSGDGPSASIYFNGTIRKPAFFSNALPSTAVIFNGTRIKSDLSGVTGLHSYLDMQTVVSDAVLTANWINNGGVTIG